MRRLLSLKAVSLVFWGLGAFCLHSDGFAHGEVTIRKVEGSSTLLQKPWNYYEGLSNALSISKLSTIYGANAAHYFIDEGYKKLFWENFGRTTQGFSPKLNVFQFPVLAPGFRQVYTNVVAIGNPVVLEALRTIPRYEVTDHEAPALESDLPRIAGGYSFQVLDAIGMDILSTVHLKHVQFTQDMIRLLTFKKFEDAIIKNSKVLLAQVDMAQRKGEKVSLDFRVYALKIFLNGFFPGYQVKNKWVKQLSAAIEKVSGMAFASIMNPYSDLEKLKLEAMVILDPFLNDLLKIKNSNLRESLRTLLEGVEKEEQDKIYKQVIIALLFAGGDNVKKYLDHTLVELGSKRVREEYLNKESLTKEEIASYVEETGRLYTTIYAQPGKAIDAFTIEYRGETIYVPAGSELHYTTYQANVDTSEFGADAREFHPERYARYKSEGTRLTHLATFGSGNRVCRGKAITLGIVKYMVTELLQKYRWSAYVNGAENSHPTELGFNNSVRGEIEYKFSPFQTSVAR